MAPTTLRLAAAAALAALALAACGGDDDGGATDTTAPTADLVVHAKDALEFDRELYQVPADDPISVAYVDDGSNQHTLVVDGHEDDMRLVVTSGGSDTGSISLPPGEYTIYCDVPGHRQGGMEARIQVG